MCWILFLADAICGWTAAEQDEWIAHPTGDAEFADCIGIVDATYVRVYRPHTYSRERRLYSDYKKYHAVFFVAIVDRRGRFRYVDAGNTPRGSSETAALYLARDVFLRRGLFLLADIAYTGDDRCKTGFRAAQLNPELVGAQQAEDNRSYNSRLSSIRIRVEHAFSRLKHTWQILQSTWKMPLDRIIPTFRACCLLTNYLHRVRELHK